MQLTVVETSGHAVVFEDKLDGWDIAIGFTQTYTIDFSKHAHASNKLTIIMTKMTAATPFGSGYLDLFTWSASTFSLRGLHVDGTLLPTPSATHRM